MIVGIDLGTTNSLVAVWRDGSSELVTNALGETLTPSVVGLDDDGQILVGKAARERLQTHPEKPPPCSSATWAAPKKFAWDLLLTAPKSCHRWCSKA